MVALTLTDTLTCENKTRKRNCQYYGTELKQRQNANDHTIEQLYNGNEM